MNRDFDERFKRHQERFDKDFDSAKKFAVGWAIFVGTLALGLLGGGVYAIYRTLLHFGIF